MLSEIVLLFCLGCRFVLPIGPIRASAEVQRRCILLQSGFSLPLKLSIALGLAAHHFSKQAEKKLNHLAEKVSIPRWSPESFVNLNNRLHLVTHADPGCDLNPHFLLHAVTGNVLKKRQKIEELEGDASMVQKALQAVVLPAMATLSKAFMLGFNNTEVNSVLSGAFSGSVSNSNSKCSHTTTV